MRDAESTIAWEASGHSLQFRGMDSDPLLGFLGNQGTLEEEMEQMLSSRIPWQQGILEGRDLGRGDGNDALIEEKKKLKNPEDMSSNSNLVDT